MKQDPFLRLLLFGLLLLASAGAMAQRGQRAQATPEERIARMVEQYQKQLGLTDDQTAQLQDIATRSTTAIQELRANTSLSRAARMEKMKSLRAAREQDVRALLTNAQKQKYDTWQQRRSQRRQQRAGSSGS